MVTVKFEIATRATECSHVERHFLPVSTARAILGSVGGVNFNELSTSVFSFERKVAKELSPGNISYTFRKAMIMNHLVNQQIFNGNDTVFIDDSPAKLVGEVGTPIRNTLMDMGHGLASLRPGRCSFSFFRQTPLRFSKCLFICSKEAGIVNLLAIRKSSKTCKPHINTNRLFTFGKWVIGDFTGKRNKPLPSTRTPDTAGLNCPFGRTVKDSLNIANLGKSNDRRTDGISTLGIGKTIIPVSATKARIAGFFARLNSSKESLKSKVYSDRNVLKYLGVDRGKRWSVFLQGWQSLNLAIECKRLVVIFISNLTLFKEMIVQPATLIERFQHKLLLFTSRIQSILISYLMHNDYYSTNNRRKEALMGFAVCIPVINCGVLDGDV